ncbi:MAG: hypothetical protein GTN40_01465 [Candidatus Aenigmarchaeota archaeon]|nr:hypothetical protein [Candidatus Aenigmarchaeota archaeon]
MRKLKGENLKEAQKYIDLAVRASKSSKCKKSKRGAVLVRKGKVIGVGYNGAPNGKFCPVCLRENIRDNSRMELCYAIHAEQRAIINALKNGYNLKGSRLYHIKVKNGKMVPSEDLSCTLCSRMILESDVSEMVLLHSDGLTVYDAEEYNDLSFDYFIKR